jgi:phosphoglycolate phosphatase
MIRRYSLVVFDWEGTLGDTLGQILTTVATEAKRLRFGAFDEGLARQYVALGLVMAVKKLFPHLSISQHEQLLQAIQHSISTEPANVFLIPGARRIVKLIHAAGIDMAIATNKGEHSLLRALQAVELSDFFVVTRSAGQTEPKPSPQMLVEIMDSCGRTAAETLMVGDSVTDMEMAKNANVDAVGVDFYRQSSVDLRDAGALDVFDDYEQLARYLQLTE